MKKNLYRISVVAILLSVFLISCASTKSADKKTAEPSTQNESQEPGFLYIPDMDEMSSFIGNWKYLKRCESGEVVPDEKQIASFFSVVGRNDLISLQMENFLRDVKNKDIQKSVESYIKKNKLNTPFTKALLKKYNSVENKYESSGHEEIQYSYNNEEFDENITLYDFNEIHPFNDEFGLLLFNNNWGALRLKDIETDELSDEDHFYLIYGGGTNSISVAFQEYKNVETEEAFADIINGFIKSKKEGEQKDEWNFYQLNKSGALENSGVDEYLIYSRIGSELFAPEISAGDFGAFLYSEKYQKVYKVEFHVNFSVININYEIRQRIFDYVRFFTLFCYCD